MKKMILAAGVATAGLLATGPGATAALADGTPPLCQTGCVTTFVPPGAGAHGPFGIARGPLGSEWFADGPGNTIDRVSPLGAITAYPVPTPGANPGWVTVDDSGTVWFAERFAGKIGELTPDGTITEFPLPSPSAIPQGIVAAPDGNLYITEQGANAIARLDPVTGQVTQFPVPTPAATPLGLALGRDGALWFVERSAAKIGRMTPDGTFTEYPLAPGASPNRIVAGPDGALWFTELFGGKIGRITTAGDLTEYPLPGGPVGITVGRNGNLYVALFSAHGLDQVNLAGQVTGHWDLPGALQVATGAGLTIWVADNFGGKVYRVTPYLTGGLAASPALAGRGPKWEPRPVTPFTLPAAFCGFKVRVTFPVDKEYGKALTAADGTTLITGSLTATYTNLSTGKAITEKLNGPGKITRRPGSLTVAVKGRSGLFLSPADARRFALPTVAVTAGAQTVTLALPSGALTSLTLHGHVLVNVCAALS